LTWGILDYALVVRSHEDELNDAELGARSANSKPGHDGNHRGRSIAIRQGAHTYFS
jgi:hypothetical protein